MTYAQGEDSLGVKCGVKQHKLPGQEGWCHSLNWTGPFEQIHGLSEGYKNGAPRRFRGDSGGISTER